MSRLAIVTGGSRGIGREIVMILLDNGFKVIFTYKNSASQAEEMMKERSDSCYGYRVDHSSLDSIELFSKEILESHGTPFLLVNSVGILKDEVFFNQSFDDFWKIFQINFASTVFLIKQFTPFMMKNRSGHIINISSIAANKPKIGNSAYGTSKIAIERFSKSLALELARFNIYVNCISPGFVESDMLNDFLKNKDKASFYKNIPFRKTLIPNDIANTIMALCNGLIQATGSVISLGNGENIL